MRAKSAIFRLNSKGSAPSLGGRPRKKVEKSLLEKERHASPSLYNDSFAHFRAFAYRNERVKPITRVGEQDAISHLKSPEEKLDPSPVDYRQRVPSCTGSSGNLSMTVYPEVAGT